MNEVHQVYLEQFLGHLSVLGYQKRSSYKKAVRELLERMETQGKLLQQISHQDLQAHYDYLSQRPNDKRGGALSIYTIKWYWFCLRLFFAYAQKRGWLCPNPMSGLSYSFPSAQSRIALSPSQIQALYEVCQSAKEEALLALFYGCGLRRSEAVHLSLRDIDFRSGLLYVRKGKGKKRRVIPLAPKVSEALKNYCYQERPNQITQRTTYQDHKAYMLNTLGKAMKGNTYYSNFKALVQQTNLPASTSLHHLRHSIATHLLVEGMELERVRDFLGHEYLETTQIYTHIDEEQLRMNN